MLKKIYGYFMAAVLALSVLLCGCGKENRGDIIPIGNFGTDSGPEDSPGAGSRPGGSGQEPADAAAGEQKESGNQTYVQPEAEIPMIRVYVCGAVVCPGVVEIPRGSRIEDALAAAGGFLPDAPTEAVNLADWAADGQMIYFPTAAEAADRPPAWEGQGVRDGQDGLVDINTADAALLCTLPGIGEAKAADIIAYREAHGGFACAEDIMKVPGIKTNIYEKICDKISVKQ